MIQDPASELFAIALRTPDDQAPDGVPTADLRVLALARRRFGLALPPPFVPAPDGEIPIRAGGGTDGPAIAVVQRRSMRARYRSVLGDDFLDRLDFSYLGALWTGLAAVPPTPRHRLLVAGRRGEVHGMVATGPARDDDLAGESVGEVRSLYLDPTVIGRGLGRRLLHAAVDTLHGSGFDDHVLWVVEGNRAGRAFYEGLGWEADGARRPVSAGGVSTDEVRYRPASPATTP